MWLDWLNLLSFSLFLRFRTFFLRSRDAIPDLFLADRLADISGQLSFFESREVLRVSTSRIGIREAIRACFFADPLRGSFWKLSVSDSRALGPARLDSRILSRISLNFQLLVLFVLLLNFVSLSFGLSFPFFLVVSRSWMVVVVCFGV